MRRGWAWMFAWAVTVTAQGQGYLPLSRTVEAPWTAAIHHRANGMHGALRPYAQEEIEALPLSDSLRPTAALAFLRNWGADSAGWRLRGGPLLDAELGLPMSEEVSTTYRAGLGAWLEWAPLKDVVVHADGQVWNETFPEYLDTLVRATRVSLGEGLAIGDPSGREAGEPYTHYDWNAYIDYKAPKFFRFTLGRGKHFIGEGYRSLLLSDNATSYPYFKITTTAWHIRYVNIFTMLSDIRGADDPASFHRKFASFHFLSWNVSRRVNLGVFESIIWSEGDEAYPRGFDINYLNPVIVYRPLEYAQGSADNALIGIQASVKVGGNSLAYGQLMLDEFLLKEVRAGNGWFGNKQGFQLGFAAFNAFKVQGLTLRTEVNYVRPFMYTHSDTRQNYSHHGQPLAHPYGSNFREWLLHVDQRRGRWTFTVHLSTAYLGSDTGLYSSGNNIFRPESDRPPTGDDRNYGYYLGDEQPVRLFLAEPGAAWLVDPRSGLSLEASYLFRSRVPEAGDNLITNWFRIGIRTHLRDRQLEQEVRYVLP